MQPALGVVTALSPLKVRLNGDTRGEIAEALSDFTGASLAPVDGGPGGTEVLVLFADKRRFALRVLA